MTSPDGRYRYNSPPNWPAPPAGWVPPPGWAPLPEWGPAPADWQFWLPVEDALNAVSTAAAPAPPSPPAEHKKGFFERRREEHAEHDFEKATAEWQHERAEVADMLDRVRDGGVPATELTGFMAKPGETGFLDAQGASLVEVRRGPSHWEGGSQGVSFRIAKGVSYRVGATRGHVVQGEEAPAAIDVGRLVVTDQRAVFEGASRTREWLWSKLVGYEHDPTQPITRFQVSNREKVSGVMYTVEAANRVRFRIELALATYRGTVPDLTARLERELAEIDARRPVAPA